MEIESLLTLVSRYTEAHADSEGVAQTPISGLTTIRATTPSPLQYAIYRPLVCLVLQGSKRVTMQNQTYTFSAGDSLIISADVPTVSQVTSASEASPYLSLVLDLDFTVITELTVAMKNEPDVDGAPLSSAVQVVPTDLEVSNAALRLIHLLDHPASVPVLQAQLVREMHYWLLAGRHGASIRRLGWPDGQVQRIASAVAILRAEFAKPLPVERLAAAVKMSPSSFHQHFRAVTSLSPLQFQKQLRLIEARRLMLSEGKNVSSSAFAVGYESVSQFTREYRRMFGLPPAQEIEVAKDNVKVAVSAKKYG